MSRIETLFITEVYRAPIEDDALVQELAAGAVSLSQDDEAGRAWSRRNGYPGYTSYASLNDLPWRQPAFGALVKRLDGHVAAFAKALELDLARRKLALDSLWVNVLDPGGAHTGHVHPHSVISGTVYLRLPPGSSPLRLEDPRLPLMMAAPPRKAKAAPARRTFVYLAPEVGEVILWESWLRHEAPANGADAPRISASFNYRWG